MHATFCNIALALITSLCIAVVGHEMLAQLAFISVEFAAR